LTRKADKYFWLGVVFLVGLMLRVYGLNRSLGGGDENQYLLDYAHASVEKIVTTFFFGGHHVFHTLLMRLMIICFGDENAIAIRFPSFISGLGALWLVYAIAWKISGLRSVALSAALITAACPVHIYYSQTARGYGLMIFLSALTIYAALNLLENSSSKVVWASVMTVSGFLSIYTLATNVYFIFSLIIWIGLVLYYPVWKNEFQLRDYSYFWMVKIFTIIFIVMGILSLAVYWPLLGNLIQEARDYHIPKTSNGAGWETVSYIFPKIMIYFFPGYQSLFLPFVLIGIFSRLVLKNSYRSLPVVILMIPFLMVCVTGIGGYPRNYLFNLPLMIIFLAIGLRQFAAWIPGYCSADLKALGLVFVCSLAGLYTLVSITYPSMVVPDGKLYQQLIIENSRSNDLVLIADKKKYLYANTIYKKNLKEILFSRRMASVKMISPNPKMIFDYQVFDGSNFFSVFSSFSKDRIIKGPVVNEGQHLFSLGLAGKNILEEDYELDSRWISIVGEGVKSSSGDFVAGTSAAKLATGPSKGWTLQAPIVEKVRLNRYALVIFIWAMLDLVNQLEKPGFGVPSLIFYNVKSGIDSTLRLGQINYGINPSIEKVVQSGERNKWQIFAFVGMVPPGEYLMNLKLALLPKQKFLVDGLRLFFVD
tara:strand:- start:1180 stop:3126 length:1947 start_codon:yes stop_codon:yes gene_type:complete